MHLAGGQFKKDLDDYWLGKRRYSVLCFIPLKILIYNRTTYLDVRADVSLLLLVVLLTHSELTVRASLLRKHGCLLRLHVLWLWLLLHLLWLAVASIPLVHTCKILFDLRT